MLPLDGNPHAMLSGTETFSAGILAADVGYAVFGPGVFTGATVGGSFQNGALGGFNANDDFVYAYHVQNTGSTPLSSLQLTLNAGSPITDLGEDPLADPQGISPTVIAAVGQNAAAYIFVAQPAGLGQISNDQTSAVLLLSGSKPPAFTNASLIDSGIGAQGMLPTPVPEPSAAWLAVVALGVAGAARRSSAH